MRTYKKALGLLVFILITVCIALTLASCGECEHTVTGSYKISREATCSLAGEQTALCLDCGASVTKPIAKKAHKYGDYKPNDDGTCTFMGTESAYCEVCGEKTSKVQDGNPYGHTFFDGTCSLCSEKMELVDTYDASLTTDDSVTVKVYKAIDGHYELDVTGIGNMRDYTETDKAPWGEHSAYITTIHFYEGISSIGDRAFYELTLADNLYVEAGLKSFGKNVFPKGYSPSVTHVFDIATWVSFEFEDEGVPPIYDTNLIYIGKVVTDESGKKSVKDRSTTLGDLIIPDGIEKINAYSFYNCAHLLTLTLPNSIKRIGEYAFYGNSRLNEVIVNSLDVWLGITFEGSFASPLAGGGSLWVGDDIVRELIIPDGISEIKPGAFEGCTSIVSVKLGSLKNLPEYAFYNCTAIKSVDFGSIESIGEWAFYSCRNLEEIALPDTLTTIGENAFGDCIRLYSVNIGNGVKTLPKTVFSGCRELVSVILGKSLTELDKTAFLGCKKIIEVCKPSAFDISGIEEFNKAIYVFENKEDSRISKITEGDGKGLVTYTDGENLYVVAYIGSEAELTLSRETVGGDFALYEMSFYRSYIKKLKIGDGILAFHDNAFLDTSITSVTVKSIEAWCNVSFKSETANPLYFAEKLFVGNSEEEILEIKIPDSVTEIPAYAFAGLGRIKSFTLPETLKAIGKDAFLDCIKAITEANNVSYIGKWAVAINKTAKSASFRSDIVGFADGMFDGASLEEISVDATILTVIPKNGIKSITVTGGKIADGAFSEFTALEYLTISSSISKESISAGAFEGCTATTVTASAAHLPLLNRAIITSLTLNGGNVKREDVEALTSLKSLTIAAGVKSVEKGCFKDFKTLESVNIRGGINVIPEGIFEGCSALKTVTLHNDVITIGKDAFRGCISAMKYESGAYYIDKWLISVIGIEDYVVILSDTVGIANGALTLDTRINKIYFLERSAYWAVIKKNVSANSAIDNSTVYFYREMAPYTEGDFWHYVDGVPTAWPPYVKQ